MDHNGEHRFSCWIDGCIDTQFDGLINLWQYKIRANQLDLLPTPSEGISRLVLRLDDMLYTSLSGS